VREVITNKTIIILLFLQSSKYPMDHLQKAGHRKYFQRVRFK